jgi:hypothetical protein
MSASAYIAAIGSNNDAPSSDAPQLEHILDGSSLGARHFLQEIPCIGSQFRIKHNISVLILCICREVFAGWQTSLRRISIQYQMQLLFHMIAPPGDSDFAVPTNPLGMPPTVHCFLLHGSYFSRTRQQIAPNHPPLNG